MATGAEVVASLVEGLRELGYPVDFQDIQEEYRRLQNGEKALNETYRMWIEEWLEDVSG